MNGHLINHIMYADDLVLISSSSAGLCQLLLECEKFGMSHGVKYNAKKHAVMIFRYVTLKWCFVLEVKVKGVTLHVVATYKYLGNCISDDFSDDDINRQCRTLYVLGNMILQKISMCFLEVKLTLFHSYWSPMYAVQLWWNYKKSTLIRLHIAHHNILKLFIGTSKYESTSLLCTLFDVQSCHSVIRSMVYRFICRLDSSVNYILNDILTSSLRFTSRMRKHWNKLLYVNT